MTCKAAVARTVNGVVGRPGPGSKAGALIVAKGLLNLVARIHDGGPIVHQTVANWTTLQHEKIGVIGAVLKDHFSFGIEVNRRVPRELSIANLQRTAPVE